MNDKIKKIKEYCLKDVDSETYEENRKDIQELEKALNESEMYKSWQDHEITKRIQEYAKKEHLDCSKTLATSRTLTDEERTNLWARQDAAKWIIDIGSQDVESEMRDINLKLDRILSAI
jgi:hypothetical protein